MSVTIDQLEPMKPMTIAEKHEVVANFNKFEADVAAQTAAMFSDLIVAIATGKHDFIISRSYELRGLGVLPSGSWNVLFTELFEAGVSQTGVNDGSPRRGAFANVKMSTLHVGEGGNPDGTVTHKITHRRP